ncbi:MFS transporter [Paenibacillus chitinolyticus]|uniref:MFS transporter n=1 Tax=Paenibacillus chitinolyticus TaxID=79263 RepID=UPI0036D89C92
MQAARTRTKELRPSLLVTAICLGAFISHFTAGIVNVSLPQFAAIFGTTLGTAQWITTGYLLVIASLLPVMGKLGDRWGFRLIHNLGYILFGISSVLVAFSPNIEALLGFRIVQAVGAAMFQATNMALITLHLPKQNRGRALGTVNTAVALGAMSGPIAGGMVAEWLNWHWLFLIHVPVAALATLLAFRFIPPAPAMDKQRSAPFDTVGGLMFMAIISSVIWTISGGSSRGWLSPVTTAVLASAALLLAVFLIWERRQANPFIPVRAFRIPALSAGLIISCVAFVLANSFLVTLPFYLSGVSGMSPSAAGAVMTAYPILLAVTGPFAGHLSDRFGSGLLVLLGLLAMGGGAAVFSLGLGVLPMAGLVALLALVGLGMGLITSPNNSTILHHAPKEHVGSIGGMIALTRNLGMVVGAALGLGVVQGAASSASSEPDRLLGALSSVFAINVCLCAGAIALLGLSFYLEKRRRVQLDPVRSAQPETHP